MRIGVEQELPIGHRLMDYNGRCASLHGHNYRVCVELQGLYPSTPYIQESGLLVDFSVVKKALNDILDPFDHAIMLRDDDPLGEFFYHQFHLGAYQEQRLLTFPWNPTAENFALFIREEMAKSFGRLFQVKVRVYETTKCYAEV
jgi:6-pyruvoyltetrahydropterin/6-carboxytetrahydropterin synthase